MAYPPRWHDPRNCWCRTRCVLILGGPSDLTKSRTFIMRSCLPDRSTNLLGSLGVVTALHPSRRKDIRAFLPAGVQLAKNRSWVVSTGLLCFMAIALLAACNGGERSTLGLTAEPTATPMPTPEPTATPMPTPEPTATPMPTPEPTPALTLTPLPDLPEPVTKEMMDAGPDTYGFTSWTGANLSL